MPCRWRALTGKSVTVLLHRFVGKRADSRQVDDDVFGRRVSTSIISVVILSFVQLLKPLMRTVALFVFVTASVGCAHKEVASHSVSSEDLKSSYKEAVAAVKKRTRFPIYLPLRLTDRYHQVFVKWIDAVSFQYAIEIDGSLNCDQDPNCLLEITIYGFIKPSTNTPWLSGKRVRLRSGTIAYWNPAEPHIGIGNSALTFFIGKHLYVVAIRNGSSYKSTVDEAIMIANSMVKF